MNPKPLSSLNHFTVPVAIVPSRGYVRCETRRVQRSNNCENAGHRFWPRLTLDPFPTSLASRARQVWSERTALIEVLLAAPSHLLLFARRAELAPLPLRALVALRDLLLERGERRICGRSSRAGLLGMIRHWVAAPARSLVKWTTGRMRERDTERWNLHSHCSAAPDRRLWWISAPAPFRTGARTTRSSCPRRRASHPRSRTVNRPASAHTHRRPEDRWTVYEVRAA